MEKANDSIAGARGVKWARAFMIFHVLILFSLSCGYLSDGMDVYKLRFGQNASVILTALITLNLKPIGLYIAFLIGLGFVNIGALFMSLIALFCYKNQEAKAIVVFGIVLIIITSLLILGSPDIF